MDKLFQIGEFCFRLRCPDEIAPPKNFMLFETGDGMPEYTYDLMISDSFPEIEGDLIARRPDLLVYKSSVGESRLIGIKGMEGYYACYQEVSENRAEIVLAPDRLRGLNVDPVFTSLLALERRMVEKDSMVLHCAYVRYQGEAILFSAPSETGKTTQANLWEKFRGSRTINGDRALLEKQNGRWLAQGWPVCGSSEVCHNEVTPVRAIVMLSQAKENEVRMLKPSEAFTLLYGQITMNGWNRDSIVQTMDLIENLIGCVPVFHLKCTISEEAVDCLDRGIMECM